MKISTLLRKGTERIRKCWVNRSPKRGECCAYTAVLLPNDFDNSTAAHAYLRNAGDIVRLIPWNDHPERKKSEVLALFKKAHAEALRDEAKDTLQGGDAVDLWLPKRRKATR